MSKSMKKTCKNLQKSAGRLQGFPADRGVPIVTCRSLEPCCEISAIRNFPVRSRLTRPSGCLKPAAHPAPVGMCSQPSFLQRGSVLLITLGFILLITVIAVAFLVRSRGSLQTSQSYSREMVAKEVGEVGINAITAQFQKEIAAPGELLLPDRTGVVETNPRNASLIRLTTDSHNISSNSTAKNGWTFDAKRWKTPALLTDAQYDAQTAVSSPKWVYVYGNTSTENGSASDVIGRYSAMVYDVGGLIDINEAGVPGSLPKGDKGSSAFVDFSALPGGSSLTIANWRSGNATVEDYYGAAVSPYGNSTYSDAVDPKKAGRISSRASRLGAGENRFFSRMELIEAAKTNKLGLSEALLPYFRTRSESANRISVENLFAYGTNATIGLAHDDLRATRDLTFTVDRINGTNGTTETYTIKRGQPVIQNRFPLARLRWLADREVDGTPKHPREIKKYFGLTWNTSTKMFFYTSPDRGDDTGLASTDGNAVAGIKTLKDLATQINTIGPVREPDFFEWLKAGINPDSLGQTGGSTWREFSTSPSQSVPWEMSKDLHILRIGANIIDQSDPDSIPTCIRSKFSGVDPDPFDSFGQENLPGINEVIAAVYRPDNAHLDGFLQFELWNPNREAYSTTRTPKGYDGRPLSRIRVGTTGGTIFMQPYIYMASKFNYPKTPLTGKESSNFTWGNYDLITLYSKGEHPLLTNPLTPSASSFHPQNLINQFIEIPISGNWFFSEPAVARTNGSDFTTKVSNGYTGTASNQSWLYLGASPSNLLNAIRFMTVDAPRAGIVGVPLSCTTNSTSNGIYVYGATGAYKATTNTATKLPSGEKTFNAAVLFSYTGVFKGITTSPVTLQIEVLPAGSNSWIPANRYHNLAFGIGQDVNDEGRIKGVLTGSINQNDAVEANWQSAWTGDRDFTDWTDVGARKGYLMSDPRTERFGLSETNQATPGQGIYPLSRTMNTPFSIFAGSGITNNMPCGTITAVGGNFDTGRGAWNAQGPAATTPLEWHVFEPNIRMSPPAYLAWNDFNNDTATGVDAEGNPTAPYPANHAYKDYDRVARPGDARWIPRNIHPARLAITLPPDVSSTPNADVLAARPTILDRPFRNVAELGCVFRDIPWKSLDLFSPDSADSRLLDIFSIEDRATVTGKINPNLARVETLQALVRGSSLDPSSSSNSTVSSSTADSVANIFGGLNPVSSPIHSSANMTARLSTSPVSKADGGYSPYKTKAENFIRALSSTTDTRNWQLMLDVVAQSGRIAPSSTNFQDFVVEGQKRFFVYLTLDRITGEIVDKYVEPVYE